MMQVVLDDLILDLDDNMITAWLSLLRNAYGRLKVGLREYIRTPAILTVLYLRDNIQLIETAFTTWI